MLDISKVDGDPYMSAFCERRESQAPSALDIANTALARAQQSASIFTETTDDCDRVAIEGHADRVHKAASACALAERKGEDGLALAFAKVAETEALELDRFDSAKLDGLKRPEVFA